MAGGCSTTFKVSSVRRQIRRRENVNLLTRRLPEDRDGSRRPVAVGHPLVDVGQVSIADDVGHGSGVVDGAVDEALEDVGAVATESEADALDLVVLARDDRRRDQRELLLVEKLAERIELGLAR